MSWHIPGANSVHYQKAFETFGALQAITAVYFLYSANRARVFIAEAGNLSNAKKAALRKLLGRVTASGIMMIIITFYMLIAMRIAFHPLGYALSTIPLSACILSNSLLQINSFSPPESERAGLGPLRAALEVSRRRKAVVATAAGALAVDHRGERRHAQQLLAARRLGAA